MVLMSSLPLMHGDGVDMAKMLAGKRRPHPLYTELDAAHDLTIADVLDATTLDAAAMVILVQPRVLMPEELVALDDYVRGGGRLLLFADPMMEWPQDGQASRGLADPQGGLRASLISPLLTHWGISLIDSGIESVVVGSVGAVLVHPGHFEMILGKTGDARCRTEHDDRVARCTVGRGRAVLIADADLLAPGMISKSAESGDANRRFVAGQVAALMTDDTS